MDQREFDELVRKLGSGASRRQVVGQGLGIAGTVLAASAADGGATARRRGKAESADCIETGAKCRKKKNGKVKDRCAECCSGLSDGKTCICLVDGGACSANANCCAGSCIDGVCGGGPEPTCTVLGEACKGTGRRCCDDLVCASGQGGQTDVACYVPTSGRCASTADCVYGTTCVGGECAFLS